MQRPSCQYHDGLLTLRLYVRENVSCCFRLVGKPFSSLIEFTLEARATGDVSSVVRIYASVDEPHGYKGNIDRDLITSVSVLPMA